LFARRVVFCHLGFANSFVDLGDDPGHGNSPEEPVISGALEGSAMMEEAKGERNQANNRGR